MKRRRVAAGRGVSAAGPVRLVYAAVGPNPAQGWLTPCAHGEGAAATLLLHRCGLLLQARTRLIAPSSCPAARPPPPPPPAPPHPTPPHPHPPPPRRRLHAVRTSVRSGKPLMLFVHGFPEAWFSWRHQMEAFRSVSGVWHSSTRLFGIPCLRRHLVQLEPPDGGLQACSSIYSSGLLGGDQRWWKPLG